VNIACANIDVRSSLGLSLSPSPPNFLLDLLRAKHFEAAFFSFVSYHRVLYRGTLLQKPQLSLFTVSLDRRARTIGQYKVIAMPFNDTPPHQVRKNIWPYPIEVSHG
jgi:hypothetical protein